MYLGSQAAAEHAFEATRRHLEIELKLQINPDKSGVARASARDFLGYGPIGRDKARLKVIVREVVAPARWTAMKRRALALAKAVKTACMAIF